MSHLFGVTYILIDFYYTRKIVADNQTLKIGGGVGGGISYIVYLLLKKGSLNLNTHYYLFIQRDSGSYTLFNKLEKYVLDEEMSKDEYCLFRS